MGPADDPRSVTSSDGRVHGLLNLRLADASIMPSVVRAHTHLTAIAIGEQISQMVRERAMTEEAEQVIAQPRL